MPVAFFNETALQQNATKSENANFKSKDLLNSIRNHNRILYTYIYSIWNFRSLNFNTTKSHLSCANFFDIFPEIKIQLALIKINDDILWERKDRDKQTR